MDKLAIFKSSRQQFRDLIKFSNSTREHRFGDQFLRKEMKDVEFKHSWANMAHMHDLRVWTLAYSPGRNNMQRM
jgi:hypothetical protein